MVSTVHVCIGSGRYCTNVLRVQSESVLQPLYIKLKEVPDNHGGGGPCLRACYRGVAWPTSRRNVM